MTREPCSNMRDTFCASRSKFGIVATSGAVCDPPGERGGRRRWRRRDRCATTGAGVVATAWRAASTGCGGACGTQA